MADGEKLKNNLAEASKILEQIRIDGAELENNFGSIGNSISKALKSAGNDAEYLEKFSKSAVQSLGRSAAKLTEVQKANLAGAKTTVNIENEAAKARARSLSLQSKISVLQGQLVNATGEEREALLGVLKNLIEASENADLLVEAFEELVEAQDKLNSDTSFFDGIGNALASFPVLGPLLSKPFKDASANIKQAKLDGKNFFEIIGEGAGAFTDIILTGLVASLFKADSATTQLSKQLGVSKDVGRELRRDFEAIAIASGTTALNSANLVESFVALGDNIGAVSGFTDEQLVAQAKLTELVGLQSNEASKLNEFGVLNGITTRGLTVEILDQVVALEQQTGIQLKGQKILAEVARINGQLGAQYGYNTQEIARAVIQANRLGLSLEDTQGIASNLLDFEQSITNELQAELLLGRNLNLEQARLLALQGDSAGAAAELAKQFGSAEEFTKLNVIQQKSLADSMGMSVDQLADSIRKQEVLNTLGAKNIEQLAEEGRLNELRSVKNGEFLLQQYEQQSAADKFQQAVTKIQMAIGTVVEGPLGGLIDGFANLLASSTGLYTVMGLIAGVSLVRVIGSMVSLATAIAGGAAGAVTLSSALTVGLGFAAIVAAVAGIMSLMNSSAEKAKESIKPMDDGIIPAGYGDRIISTPKGSVALNNNDTIVAGTNLGQGSQDTKRTNMLLEKLIKQNSDKPQLSPVGLYEVQ